MPFVETQDKRRILFIHVPKTGGTSVEDWMQTLGTLRLHHPAIPVALKCTPQHLRMSDLNNLFGKRYFDYAFMIVRNPYDRIASEYRMRAELQADSFFRMWPSFSHWLEVHLDKLRESPWMMDNHLRPQWEFHGSGVRVFKLEDGLDKALAKVARSNDVAPPAEVAHRLKTDKSPVEIEWDISDRLRIEDTYAKDFEEFGYDQIR